MVGFGTVRLPFAHYLATGAERETNCLNRITAVTDYTRVIITPSRYLPPPFGAARCGALIEYIDGIFFPPPDTYRFLRNHRSNLTDN
jgi:hypothetical protein